MSKILIHSLTFSPDGVSTAYLYNDIALRFKASGYDVLVLTTTPHYNIINEQLEKQPLKKRYYGLFYESDFNGIRVIHIPQKKFKSTLLRLFGFVFFHLMSFCLGLFQRDIDVILSPSPPLTIGVINIWLAKIKRCKTIYNVQEIYPDILEKGNGIIVSFLSKMERYVYNQSSLVTTIDQVFYDTIMNRFIDKSKLHIIPNFVDTQLYNPYLKNDITTKFKKKTNSIVLLYAGNIGFAQDWNTLISLAQKTINKSIEYLIVGEGVMKSYIEQKKKEFKLKNIHILPYQPRSMMPNIIAYSDLQFIFMDPKMDMQGFPSKTYTIMACAKPLLVCSSANSPIIKFLEDKNCAKLITEQNYNKKISEINEWICSISKLELIDMGKNGLKVINNSYTKDIVTDQYVKLVDSIL
ncbi:MAG: glycosyltransferase family 4 protein [Muribaculaceae bacterium]